MQRKNPSPYSGCKAPLLHCISGLFSYPPPPSSPLSLFQPEACLLLPKHDFCSVFPLPGMLFPRIHPANSITAFENLFKSHLSNENYPLTLFNTQSFPTSKWQFQSPLPCSIFFLFFIAFISPFDLLCHLLILLIHYCLSSLLESKLWETDVCLFCQLVYFKTLELCLAHSKDFVNTWWMNALSLSRGFHFGHPFWECSLHSETFLNSLLGKINNILYVFQWVISHRSCYEITSQCIYLPVIYFKSVAI